MTKTVDGRCADCWAVKDWTNVHVPSRPRTERLFQLHWDEPADVLIVVVALAVAVLVAARLLA